MSRESKDVLCLFGITITYDSDTSMHAQDAIFAQLVVSGEVKQVIDGSTSVVSSKTTSGILWRLEGHFPIASAWTAFSVHVSSRRPQGQIFETKFHHQFTQVGYTLDHVGIEIAHNGIRHSFKANRLRLYSWNRPNTFQETETKTRTNSHTNPLASSTTDGRESLDREKQRLQNLLDSPSSKERAGALLSEGLSLKDQYQDTKSIEYLHLAIQALHAARASGWGHLDFPHAALCLLLFRRSTLPGGNSFIDDAFDALKGLSSVMSAEAFMGLLPDVLLILEEQDRADYAAIAFRVVAPLLRILAPECSTNSNLHPSIVRAAQLSIRLASTLKETLTIVDIGLKVTFIHFPEFYDILLMQKAILYIQQFEARGDPDSHSVRVAIEEARTHIFEKRGLVGEGRASQIYGDFLTLAIKFLGNLKGSLRESALLYRVLSDLELKMELEGADFSPFRHLRHAATQNISQTFQHRFMFDPQMHQVVGDLILLSYGDRFALDDDDIKFMQEQVASMVNNEVFPVYPTENTIQTMCTIINTDFGILAEPRDQVIWLQAFFVAATARTLGLPFTLNAYQCFMLGAGFWGSSAQSLELRYSISSLTRSIASDAISYALGEGRNDLALEWVDQCSSIVLSQSFRYHSELAQISAINPKLAKRLNELTSPLTSKGGRSGEALDWEDAMREVRKLPDFDWFLRPKTPSKIRSAAKALGGPLIYFNINRFSCDALCIVPGSNEVLRIPLPGLIPHELNRFASLLPTFPASGTAVQRAGKLTRRRHAEFSLPMVLGYLWDNVVKSILDALSIQQSKSESAEDLPRIWWCPSGPLALLPLHAAGYYANDTDDNIMNYVVSSYIPSASVISQVTRVENTTADFHLLAVADPQGCELLGTRRELSIIQKHIAVGHMTELVGPSATSEAVKEGLEMAPWAHFACHGVQETALTMKSALIFADNTHLTLGEILRLSLPHAQFAFLSACQTAQGARLGADESAHLAAGMLVAGYRSVIGTTWRISDAHTPDIVDHFYKRMFEGGRAPDYRRSAFALHDAVRMLRKEVNLEFQDWVPFIHFGA